MMYLDFSSLFHVKNCVKTLNFNEGKHLRHKSPKFGGIGASLILKFGRIGALQNFGNLLKIRRAFHLERLKNPL